MEKDGQAGYKVVYPDGYESWSPKKVFEKFYFPLDDGPTITDATTTRFYQLGHYDIRTVDERCTLMKYVAPTGYYMVASSSCVDPTKYSERIGVNICINSIKDRLCGLLGFVLAWGKYGLRKS